jgi:hypothetical protein
MNYARVLLVKKHNRMRLNSRFGVHEEGTNITKRAFCFKRKREEGMAKEWANKDKYHPFDGVLEPRVQLPRAKASVRSIRAWGERKAVGGAAAQATLVRPVWSTGQTGVEHRSDRCRPGQAAVWVSCSYRCEVWFWSSWFWWLSWRLCRRSVC